MKNALYSMLAVLLFFSCSKSEETENCIDDVCITGEWQWVQSYGTIAGVTITPETEMMNKDLIIDESTYGEFVDNVQVVEVGYEFVKSGELSAFSTDSLVLKLNSGNWYSVEIDNNILTLMEPCADCWTHTYEKK